MKLFSVLLATASAISCPSGWTANNAGDKCAPDGLQVDCTTDKMTVTMKLNHLYFEGETMFDNTQKLSAKALAGDCEVDVAKIDSNGDLVTTAVKEFDLGACGTVATHETGNLVYTTTFRESYYC